MTNQEPVAISWEAAACRTFGSPWIELVLRAGRANATVGDSASDSRRELISEAYGRVWNLCAQAQEHHRRSAPLRDPAHAAMLSTAHERITSLVEALEQATVQLHRARVSDELRSAMHDIDDLKLGLASFASAAAEMDAL